jgi:hypothetical protein
MAWISKVLYSSPCSISVSCERTTSLLRRVITSSMLRGPTRSIASVRTFLEMWMLGEDRARRMSMMTSCSTLAWCFFRSLRRSSTISFTLLSLEVLFSREA